MLPFQLQKLPNEIILKVFSYLETKDLIQYGHVSKRIRDICHDESLWKKINLYDKIGQFFYLVIYFFDISKSHNGYILVVSLIFQGVFFFKVCPVHVIRTACRMLKLVLNVKYLLLLSFLTEDEFYNLGQIQGIIRI